MYLFIYLFSVINHRDFFILFYIVVEANLKGYIFSTFAVNEGQL